MTEQLNLKQLHNSFRAQSEFGLFDLPKSHRYATYDEAARMALALLEIQGVVEGWRNGAESSMGAIAIIMQDGFWSKEER